MTTTVIMVSVTLYPTPLQVIAQALIASVPLHPTLLPVIHQAQALCTPMLDLHTPVTITPFTSPVGPKVDIPDSPSDIFQLMFTPDLLDSIVEQSNLYAKEVMGEDKYSAWVKITTDELKAYLGFCILMGINHLPALDDYWSTDPMLHYSPVADQITRDRFREISRYLHFVDNATLTPRGSPGHDRLGKVRPVLDHLSSHFLDLYDPHREVAIDEAMIKFTGCSSLKQYMPMKPIKRDIKVWALADSHNGYFHQFQVYTGKEGSGEKQLGQRVIKDLTKHLKGKHHVFFDNFFLPVSSCCVT